MKNRYGVVYDFKLVAEDTYHFEIPEKEMDYCRYGGKHGENHIDWQDLGMVDPSGGPFISLGMKLNGKQVSKIWVEEHRIYIKVE